MSIASRGEYLHFRCAWHAVDGSFEQRSGFERRCGVKGCQNKGMGYWYRGAKYAELPVPKSDLVAYG